jgi:hypothetical protein
MPPVGFETTNATAERPHTNTLDRAAIENDEPCLKPHQ